MLVVVCWLTCVSRCMLCAVCGYGSFVVGCLLLVGCCVLFDVAGCLRFVLLVVVCYSL